MIVSKLAQQREEEANKPFVYPTRGNPKAPIVVLCDVPSIETARKSLPMSVNQLKWFAKTATKNGFAQDDFLFVGLCPPMPKEARGSKAREWQFIAPHAEQAKKIIEDIDAKVVVTFGNNAARAMFGRAVKITKARGILSPREDAPPLFPMLPPGMLLRIPDNIPIFEADLSTLVRLKNGGYDTSSLMIETEKYEWRTDISDFLGANKPKYISFDTETTNETQSDSFDTRHEDFRVITAQFSTAPGNAFVCPVDRVYWPEHTDESYNTLMAQLKELLEDPEVKKIGQNIKYDHGAMQAMDIEICGWEHDTELMARMVNENMLSYGQDDLVRVYAPEKAGYADGFNGAYDKSRMREVPRDDMLKYAGGDTDTCFRIARTLYGLLNKEPSQMRCYKRINAPALVTFAKSMEPNGQMIDRDALENYEEEVAEWVEQEERALLRMVPAKIRRKFIRSGEEMKFSRQAFLQQVLFSEDGFNLTPRVWTKSTAELPPERRVPSTSTKDHLPYFTDRKDRAGEFCQRLIEFQKAQKMLSTYIRGFYKYIKPSGKVHPIYNFRTNTHRTNSQDPNGQNFPKRGRFAKGFRKLIKASDGKVLVAADLSQAELRIAAWMANEPQMLDIYNQDGDIHAATAAAVSRIPFDVFMSWKKNPTLLQPVAKDIPGAEAYLLTLDPSKRAEATLGSFYDIQRFRAKAVNFGYLYGAWWTTFQTYAKTQYGADYTDEQAQETRVNFFENYQGLVPWHERMKAHAHEHGVVYSLHGHVRHLPSIYSNDDKIKQGAERNAVNSPVQNMGSDLGVIAINRLASQADPSLIRPIGFVHDQIVTEVDPAYVKEAMGWLVWIMENPPLLEWFGIEAPLPIKSDPEFGPNLAEMVELGDNDCEWDRGDLDISKPDWWNDNEEEAQDHFLNHIRMTN